MSTPAFVALGIVLALFGAAIFGYALMLLAGDGGEARRAIALLVALVSAAWVALISSEVLQARRRERVRRAHRTRLWFCEHCDGRHQPPPCADAQCWRR